MSLNQLSKSIFLISALFLFFSPISCQTKAKDQKESFIEKKEVVVGANQIDKYINFLKNKNVAVVANNTSVIFKNGKDKDNSNYKHLVDSLISLGINIVKVFAPEHGFRGKADAGEHLSDGIDSLTNLPIISLYGKNRKPSPSQLENIEIVVFDMQDVGVRFYTYISTLHYVMETCAEMNIPLIVLDRPNPNGNIVDGPVLDPEFKSFVGMHPVPVVYGLTIGEYAQMINGEKWLENEAVCDLTVIPLTNYSHVTNYSLPIKPSPNLPNDKSINLYASICMFEGTNVSCGRGTEMQFQIFGSPFLDKEKFDFSFIPKPKFGVKSPKHNGLDCYGMDLRQEPDLTEVNFNWLIAAYNATADKEIFFNQFFNKLAGNDQLQSQIKEGLSFEEIKETWKNDLAVYQKVREKYLMYE